MRCLPIYFIALFSFLLVGTSLSFAQSVKELNKQKNEAEKEIAYVNTLLSQTGSEKSATLEQLNLLQTKIRYRKQLVSTTEMQIGITTKEIAQMNGQIKSLQGELVGLKESYAELISAIYTKRKSSTWLMYVLASEDIAQAYRRLKYFRSFADLAMSQANQIKENTVSLQKSVQELEQKKQELADFQRSKEAEVKNLASEEMQAQLLQKSLEKKERSLRGTLKEKQAILRNLNAEIERILAEEVRRAEEAAKRAKAAKAGTATTTTTPSKTTASLPTVDTELSARFESNRGKLPWPLQKGAVVDNFGQHEHPIFKSLQLSNNGIDISTDRNASVLAIFNGEVRRVFSISGMGNCIMLQHGDYYSVYCRMGSVSVKAGDKLKTGDVLGTVETSSDGSTLLHFELWQGRTKLNPELWLTRK